MQNTKDINLIHIPVLWKEIIDNVNVFPNITYLDGTIGYGGHFKVIFEKANKMGNFYGFDQDIVAYNYCLKEFDKYNNVHLFHANFAKFKQFLPDKKFDLILLDLGVSSLQFDDAKRGFSYNYNARLDMRMNQEQKLDAYYVINNFTLNQLTSIFKEYGECKNAFKVASEICKLRKQKLIETTFELRDIIYKIEFSHNLNRKNPAKQYFQAIRIFVNDELNILKKSIEELAYSLNKNGMLAIITFHSLEDRVVKNIFHNLSNEEDIYKKLPINKEPNFQLVNKKPIVATEEELQNNNRSHSAKLRIIKRIKL